MDEEPLARPVAEAFHLGLLRDLATAQPARAEAGDDADEQEHQHRQRRAAPEILQPRVGEPKAVR